MAWWYRAAETWSRLPGPTGAERPRDARRGGPIYNPPMSESHARQCADAVLMVRPAAFGWNPETRASNRFQAALPPRDPDLAAQARIEFDAAASALWAAGVEVHVVEDCNPPPRPDAVFPNNWFSTHADGTVVLYPMLAPARRAERRLDELLALAERHGLLVRRVLDLAATEQSGKFLEGTGSVVFDHVARLAYACRSPRTDASVLGRLCDELGYDPVVFDASDGQGTPVYHTNVMLSIGRGFAIVCAEALAASDRDGVLSRLQATGRRVVTIDRMQMARFAANQLEVRDRAGGSRLVMSASARSSLDAAALGQLERCVDGFVEFDTPTIESVGGGSARCMLAEIFLPPAVA